MEMATVVTKLGGKRYKNRRERRATSGMFICASSVAARCIIPRPGGASQSAYVLLHIYAFLWCVEISVGWWPISVLLYKDRFVTTTGRYTGIVLWGSVECNTAMPAFSERILFLVTARHGIPSGLYMKIRQYSTSVQGLVPNQLKSACTLGDVISFWVDYYLQKRVSITFGRKSAITAKWSGSMSYTSSVMAEPLRRNHYALLRVSRTACVRAILEWLIHLYAWPELNRCVTCWTCGILLHWPARNGYEGRQWKIG